MSDTTRDRPGSPLGEGPLSPDVPLAWSDSVADLPSAVGAPVVDGPPPAEPSRKKSKKHLIGYPATALIALVIGSSGGDEPATPLATPAPQTVTATVTEATTVTITETVTTPGPTVTETVTIAAPAPKPTAATTRKATAPAPLQAPAPSGLDPRFDTCKAAIAAGYGPYYEGKDPEYDWYRDADNDGKVCE